MLTRSEKIVRLSLSPFNFSQAQIARLYQISQARVSQIISDYWREHSG